MCRDYVLTTNIHLLLCRKTRIAKIAAIELEPVDAWTSPFGMFESTYDRRLDSHNEDHEFILDAAWTVCGLHPLNVYESPWGSGSAMCTP